MFEHILLIDIPLMAFLEILFINVAEFFDANF